MDRKFERIVNTYADMLFRIALHYLKNTSDAEDAVQQTFLKIIEKNMHFESFDHEKAWLIRVCTNLCKDSLKSSHRKKTQPLQTDADKTYSDAEDFYIIDHIRTLPHKQKIAIYLFYYENMSVKEIADTMQEKQNTVLSSLNRGRKKLAKLLKEEL